MPFEWAAAGRPLRGEICSGDAYLIVEHADGLLMAVIDGLGHGPEASVAATAAMRTMEAHGDRPLIQLVELCHAALKPTRGAALTVGHCTEATGHLEWLGVGNVEALVARVEDAAVVRTQHLMLRSGVVGMRLPRLQASGQDLQAGDLILLASDGISSRFHLGVDPAQEPARIAAGILEAHGRDSDDAMVLVVRYLGPGRAAGAEP